MTARLVPELSAVAPGATLWIDLHLDIAPGWHIYWRNPGDSGLPTEIAWTLPAGFTAGDIVWPVPEHFVVEGLGNYGYRDAVDLLIPITVGQDVKPGATARVEAAASWLVCSDICIPGDAKLALALPVSAAPLPPDPAATGLFAAARSRLPKPAAFEAGFGVTKDQLRLMLPEAAFSGIEQPSAVFFPFDANVVDAAAEPKLQRRGSGFELLLQRCEHPGRDRAAIARRRSRAARERKAASRRCRCTQHPPPRSRPRRALPRSRGGRRCCLRCSAASS